MGLARHVETGEPLPEELYQKLKAAKTFRAASMMLRQLHFAQVDLELHSRFVPGAAETASDVNARVALRTTVMPPLPEDRFLCSFSHIFAGGYSAGYYSYKARGPTRYPPELGFRTAVNQTALETKLAPSHRMILALPSHLLPLLVLQWAEVLSADAFAAFEEAGLDDDKTVASVGQKFRDTVLAMGGARAPLDVFKARRLLEESRCVLG